MNTQVDQARKEQLRAVAQWLRREAYAFPGVPPRAAVHLAAETLELFAPVPLPDKAAPEIERLIRQIADDVDAIKREMQIAMG